MTLSIGNPKVIMNLDAKIYAMLLIVLSSDLNISQQNLINFVFLSNYKNSSLKCFINTPKIYKISTSNWLI